jgi:polyphosphate:AMP phosphotransferase
MFETAELGRTLSKSEYDAKVPALRTELLRLQAELGKTTSPALVLIHGVEGSGKGDALNLLHEWLDARYLHTHAFGPMTEEERQRPEHWRYWMALPPRGRLGLWSGSWYSAPLINHGLHKGSASELERSIARIRQLETMLALDGLTLIKFWFHVPKRQQKRRFDALSDSKFTRWRVTDDDWEQHRRYEPFVRTAARVIEGTSTGEAPWTVIEATDARHRDVMLAEHLIQRLTTALATRESRPARQVPIADIGNPRTILDSLDLDARVEKPQYEATLPLLQGRLNRLSRKVARENKGVILVFEGPDASGKGGAIRRVTRALDARQYRVIPIAAPTPEERSQHYLWRFWRHLPRLGRFTIYDRSWYGRVLVERVEGFADQAEWRRAYQEINEFESQLTSHGIVLVKFWLHVSQDEQLRRFEDRQQKAWKQYKITEEDYRNRAKTPLYELAASEMIDRTSTESAPWALIEANDKRHARLRVLETLCDRLAQAL